MENKEQRFNLKIIKLYVKASKQLQKIQNKTEKKQRKIEQKFGMNFTYIDTDSIYMGGR